MELLQEDRRLDSLLKEESEESLHHLLGLLTERIWHMHNYCEPVTCTDEHGTQWGSWQQIRSKLEHNLSLFDLIPIRVNNDKAHQSYYRIKEELCRVIDHPVLRSAFAMRAKEKYIRRCHGDLKATNIWIGLSGQDGVGEAWQCVKILDAIDFNPVYCNIDVLSDLAMLVVDVEARHSSPDLAESVVQRYQQYAASEDELENEIARIVLAYYLVEKSIVRAAVSVIYDALPDLGLEFLWAAERRIQVVCNLLAQAALPNL